MDVLNGYLGRIIELIIQPLVNLIVALAVVYLIWGAAQMILKANDPKARETGRRHLIWGLIGFFIMVSVKGILAILTGTFGI